MLLIVMHATVVRCVLCSAVPRAAAVGKGDAHVCASLSVIILVLPGILPGRKRQHLRSLLLHPQLGLSKEGMGARGINHSDQGP